MSLVLQGSPSLEEGWRWKDGVLVEVSQDWVVVSVDRLDSWLLDRILAKCQQTRVKLVKRSDEDIYSTNMDRLRRLLKTTPGLSSSSPQGFVIRALLGEPEETPQPRPPPCNLTIYNPNLLRDPSSMAALAAAAARPPVSIIHGPPGTGKTTVLAACVLHAVAQGEKVGDGDDLLVKLDFTPYCLGAGVRSQPRRL